jgi:hypothetical protein
MVQGQAVGGAPAPVMAHQVEALEAQRPHDRQLVIGHRPERVVGVVRCPRRLGRGAVAAQIRTDHGVVPRQQGRHPRPQIQVLRVAVQKQQARAVAADAAMDLDVADADLVGRETFEHRDPLACRWPARAGERDRG